MNLYSLEVEVALLGTTIHGSYPSVAPLVKAEDFWRPAHRRIWKAIGKLGSKGPVDFTEVAAELGKDLEQCGGSAYLAEIAHEAFTKHNAEGLAVKVAEYAERRRTIEAAQALIAKAQDAGIEEVRAERASISEKTASCQPFVHFGLVEPANEHAGITTGFVGLDRAISKGGYPSGQMTVVSAYHKGGKTTFMLCSFVEQLAQGHKCLFATFADLGKEDLKSRMLRYLCGWGKRPDLDSVAREFDNAQYQIEAEFAGFVYDASTLETGDDFETFTGWFKSEHSKSPFGCVFLDYAQKITSADRRAIGDLAMAQTVSRKICRLAAQTGVAFVVGSQITEGNQREGRKAMTKGSRVWEEDAGWVLRIERGVENERMVEVAYSRFGKQGKKIPFRFDEKRLAFVEVR